MANIGKYPVESRRVGRDTFMAAVLDVYHGGSLLFNLERGEAYVSMGADRMNGGGYTLSFDRSREVTVGQVRASARKALEDFYGVGMPQEWDKDDTVIWPVAPYAQKDAEAPKAARPAGRQIQTVSTPAAKPADAPKRDATGRSEAAIRRDEAMRREAAAKRDAEARETLCVMLLPFLERHAGDGDWDACAERIFVHFGIREGEFVHFVKDRHWHITGDMVSCAEVWGGHSFFDDGGGVEGYSRDWIEYVPPGGEEAPAPGSSEYRENPFGLKGTYRLGHSSGEYKTD